jgi:hypothetical protein
MKKLILILINSIAICFSISAQSFGDYRSVADGNWNDATKWEMHNGTTWIVASTYPGQDPETGQVTITGDTKIIITANVPHAVASLYVHSDIVCSNYIPSEQNPALFGTLNFSAENPVSLIVSGPVTIFGELSIDERGGTKTHSLFIGGNLEVGGGWQDTCYYQTLTVFQTINQDDKLRVIFNTTTPESAIFGSIPISFQDVSFDGIGISAFAPMDIFGTASFINGILALESGGITFHDGATVAGGSNASFIQGPVAKIGDDPFTYPIGMPNGFSGYGVYSPLTISAPLVATDMFTASYWRSNYNDIIIDPDLHSISDCDYWSLIRSAGSTSYNLDVTVGWSPASGCGPGYVTNVSDVTLAKLGPGGWASHSGSGTGTTTNGSVSWYGLSNQGGHFSLANMNTNCVTPSGLNISGISSNAAMLSWIAVSGAQSYDVEYKPASSNYWSRAVETPTSPSIKLLGLDPSLTYDWKVNARCGFSNSDCRVSQFTTLPTTCNSPSGLTVTNITSNSATFNWNAVTGAVNYNVQYRKQIAPSAWMTAVAGTAALSCNLSGLSANNAYDWRVSANCSNPAQSSFTTAPAVICNDLYEANNVSGQAKAINLGVPVSAVITSPSDVDWFTVTTPNSSYTNLKVTLNNLPADYDVYVYNKSLILVGSSAGTGTSDEIVTYDSKSRKAPYYIKVAGKNGAYNPWFCYRLLVEVFSYGNGAHRTSVEADEITEVPGKQLIYPHPASGFIQLGFNSTIEGTVSVEIFNTEGQLIKQSAVQLIKGYNQVKISVSDISQGMYFIRMNKGALNITKKFVIAR